MDFISIADTAWRFHRLLSSVSVPSSAEDDDFVELTDAGRNRNPSTSNVLGAAIASSSSLYSSTSATSPTSTIPPEVEINLLSGHSDETRPFLSPSAEAELLLLATNFLLYVAMVIITALIAKLYFPECLERRRAEPPAPRSYSYRMVDGQNDLTPIQEVDDSFEDFDKNEEDDSDGVENDVYLDSEDDKDAMDQLYATPKSATRPSLLEFDQETMSKAQVFKRLLFCSLMLNITFVAWGILQERMLTRRYPRLTGEYFTYSYALVFTNRFWTLIISTLLWFYLKPRRSRSTVIYEYSFPSISNMLSSWCQYEALRYVSFPATTLFKSFKLAPVMAMGKVLGNKTYPTYDYFVALVIGVGITLFMISSDDLKFGYDIYGEASATWTGVMLLFLYLFFDSFTSQWQSRMFNRHRDLSMVELMFATSAYSTVLALVTLIHTKELYPALSFITNHPEIHLHFFAFSICSTIGQIFIFYTIKNFGAVVFTLIMTTRILLSITMSCILFGHQVTGIGLLGLMMVLGAVLYRIKRKAEGQKLLKWQGMDDDGKAQELVQEWHEHVDM